jgi:hypothetical protein
MHMCIQHRVLPVAEMDDWDSIVAVMVDCLGVRFWERTRVLFVGSPHVENEVTASCKCESWINKCNATFFISFFGEYFIL